jgi:hypothetical protein
VHVDRIAPDSGDVGVDEDLFAVLVDVDPRSGRAERSPRDCCRAVRAGRTIRFIHRNLCAHDDGLLGSKGLDGDRARKRLFRLG